MNRKAFGTSFLYWVDFITVGQNNFGNKIPFPHFSFNYINLKGFRWFHSKSTDQIYPNDFFSNWIPNFGIVFPNIFWPIAIKNCSANREKLGLQPRISKILRSLEQFFQTVKSHNNFWNRMHFKLIFGGFLDLVC